MQLRYDFGLKPDETFTAEQIAEIEKRANEARARFNSEEERSKADIDFNIVNRYRSGTIQDLLNYTAEEKADVKNAFKVQDWLHKRDIAQQQSLLPSGVEIDANEEKEPRNSSLMLPTSHHDMG
jgi:hypothetical protein